MKRLFTRSAVNGRINVPSAGDPSITARSAALGDPITPGTTRYYQLWFLDSGDPFGVGVSNAVSVTFCP